MNTLEAKTDKEILTLVQRWLELVFTVLMLLLFGFLVYHQRANTGFFTDKFKLLEMFCLYVPIVLAISAMIIRAWTGHQQPARPFEVARSLLLGLGSLWLLMVFPFNFCTSPTLYRNQCASFFLGSLMILAKSHWFYRASSAQSLPS